MKKDEFKVLVAEKLEATQKEAAKVIEAVFEAVEDGLVDGKKVPMGSLGKMVVVKRAARKGRNPRTGEEIQIAAKNAPKFNPSDYLKNLVK